jgi:hypothetical protein
MAGDDQAGLADKQDTAQHARRDEQVAVPAMAGPFLETLPGTTSDLI